MTYFHDYFFNLVTLTPPPFPAHSLNKSIAIKYIKKPLLSNVKVV